MKHYRVTFEPEGKSVFIHAGATLQEAAEQAGVILNTVCGGVGVCKKCSVIIRPGGEKVLACQFRVGGDVRVFVPQESEFFEQKILQHGIEKQIKVSPRILKKFVHPKTLSPEQIKASLAEALGGYDLEISLDFKSRLGQIKKEDIQNKGLTVVCYRVNHSAEEGCYLMVSAETGDTTAKNFGVAVDIGTTTVVACLVNMNSGETVAVAAGTNPQSIYGDDVISRIASAENPTGLEKLHSLIIDCANELIEQLCMQAGISAEDIYELTAAGNTAMNHIFLKFPVKQLGQAPYRAYSLKAEDIPAGRLGIKINAAGNVHTIENIAGFVGADTTAVAVASEVNLAEEMTLIVDIGTNGEVILGTGKKLYAVSCAAGPAFEGGRISCGSRAVKGAIERVILNEKDIDIDVIGGGKAKSICGSGLVDATAAMVELGIIEASGRFADANKLKGKLPKAIFERIIEKDNHPAFLLAGGASGQVIVTQSDIREIQLAKSAIRSGIRILQRRFGIGNSEIKHILLAGAFGNYMSRESAKRIGLLPDVPTERIHFIGNAASIGAKIVLLSQPHRQLAGQIAMGIEYVEIAREKDFADIFAESLQF